VANLVGGTTLFGTIAGSNNREDLIDVITLTDPFETPFFSMVQKGTANHTLHEWQTEALQVSATGGGTTYAEGAAFSAAGLNARTRLNNLCEIFRKDIQVTNTQRAVRPAGVSDEYLHQVQIAIKEIGRDIEITLMQGAAASAVGGTGTLRTMKPIRTWISTNTFVPSQTEIGATGVGFSTTSWAIGENAFNDVLEQVFLQGGRADTVFANGGVKRQISRFGLVAGSAGLHRRNIQASAKKLVSAVDSYESDFGVVNVVLDRFIGTADGGPGRGTTAPDNYMYFMQLDTWEIATLRPLKHVPLPPGGDAIRGMVLFEGTLVSYAEQWNAAVNGLSSFASQTADGTIPA
jgi:hypothetical protein